MPSSHFSAASKRSPTPNQGRIPLVLSSICHKPSITLRIYFWLAFGLSTTHLVAQQCPRILNCPQSTSTYCDQSTNDLSLWNNPPFTYSPTMGDSNLYEGPIDLNIKVKSCSGGGLTSISYILYLDLNSDDQQETVITSGNPPPG